MKEGKESPSFGHLAGHISDPHGIGQSFRADTFLFFNCFVFGFSELVVGRGTVIIIVSVTDRNSVTLCDQRFSDILTLEFRVKFCNKKCSL